MEIPASSIEAFAAKIQKIVEDKYSTAGQSAVSDALNSAAEYVERVTRVYAECAEESSMFDVPQEEAVRTIILLNPITAEIIELARESFEDEAEAEKWLREIIGELITRWFVVAAGSLLVRRITKSV